MKIFVIGSSIVSSYWNGAATYYRGVYRGLARLGHVITFAEPDAYGRQQHRDPGDYGFVHSWVYRSPGDLEGVLAAAAESDAVIKHSGVGVDDAWLEARIAGLTGGPVTIFWDVDAPATLARIQADADDPFRQWVSRYDAIFTYGGGAPVAHEYGRWGAQACHAIYNGLDPDIHYPVAPAPAWECDLLFVGHRLPDREARVEEFFMRAAESAPEMRFLLGGEGWGSKSLPQNVRWVGHVGTSEHNVANCSARMVLNVNRESMAATGFSPPTRVFEAAGAGACVVTDAWAGIEEFFRPGSEILVASSAAEVVRHLRATSARTAREIGHAMRSRALADHTYALRAATADRLLKAMAREMVAL